MEFKLTPGAERDSEDSAQSSNEDYMEDIDLNSNDPLVHSEYLLKSLYQPHWRFSKKYYYFKTLTRMLKYVRISIIV